MTDRLSDNGLALRVDGAVARITLQRPERRNAMTPGMWRALAHIGQSLPPAVRIVVISGAGPSFSAGLDLALLEPGHPEAGPLRAAAAGDTAATRAELDAFVAECQQGFLWLRRSDLVTIAAVHGHAIGAGLQLALACDIRIVAEDATMAMREPALGLVPDLTGTKPLVDLVGVHRAIELCLTARSVDAAEAVRLRLAEVAVPPAELEPAVADLVAAIQEIPAEAAAATKELLLGAGRRSLAEQADAERAAQVDRLLALFAPRDSR